MLGNKVANLSDRLRHGTVLEAFQYRLGRFGIVVAPYHWVQEGEDLGPLEKLYDTKEGFTFSQFGREEIKAIAAGNSWAYTEEELLAWLGQGRRCIGATFRGEIAAFMWIDCDECNCRYFRFKLEPNEAYLFDMFTMKPYRGRGLAPFLRYQGYKILRGLGRDTLYSYSDCFNAPSINFKKKLNARFLKTGLYLELFGRHRWNLMPGAPPNIRHASPGDLPRR